MARYLVLGLLVLLVPFTAGDAKTIKENCKDQCSSAYHFCLKRSLTSKAKKECKIERGNCKHGCR